MNYLSIDYGIKKIGLAYSVDGIISTLPPIKNDHNTVNNILTIIKTHNIEKIYVGLSYGRVAKLTRGFIQLLSSVIKLPIETVDEAVSTIEAGDIMQTLGKSRKDRSLLIDSVAAAVILRRVIS